MTTVRIPHSRGVLFASPEQIVRVEAFRNYSKIYFVTGHPLTVAKVLQWFQAHLPDEMFSRIHRKHLVNNLFIEQVNEDKNNTVLLRNGDMVKMSRRKKALLLAG